MDTIMHAPPPAASKAAEEPELVVLSFGYGRGPAPTAALTLDLRPLVARDGIGPQFNGLNGRDETVREHVLGLPFVDRLVNNLTNVVLDMLAAADRHNGPVVVALGSADGTRRAVVLADKLAALVNELGHYATLACHPLLGPAGTAPQDPTSDAAEDATDSGEAL